MKSARNAHCEQLLTAFVPAGGRWKAPNSGIRFYVLLVFNEKLCETTILKFINGCENI